jgi:hypothetical protein
MNNQEIIDSEPPKQGKWPDCNQVDSDGKWSHRQPLIRSLADIKRIVELEAYLQKVQADRINDIAIERKRWAKADLVALEILRLEQQIKGVNDFANKFCGDCKTLEQAAVSYCAESFIKSLKEPKL